MGPRIISIDGATVTIARTRTGSFIVGDTEAAVDAATEFVIEQRVPDRRALARMASRASLEESRARQTRAALASLEESRARQTSAALVGSRAGAKAARAMAAEREAVMRPLWDKYTAAEPDLWQRAKVVRAEMLKWAEAGPKRKALAVSTIHARCSASTRP